MTDQLFADVRFAASSGDGGEGSRLVAFESDNIVEQGRGLFIEIHDTPDFKTRQHAFLSERDARDLTARLIARYGSDPVPALPELSPGTPQVVLRELSSTRRGTPVVVEARCAFGACYRVRLPSGDARHVERPDLGDALDDA